MCLINCSDDTFHEIVLRPAEEGCTFRESSERETDGTVKSVKTLITMSDYQKPGTK